MMFPASAAQLPGFFASFAAGLLSFLSPCVLPLIPVYLSFITGESAASLRGGKAQKASILFRSLFFVAGFTLVFVVLAVIFGGGMRFIGNSASLVITRVAGVLVIILGINTLFDFLPFLRRDLRPEKSSSLHPSVKAFVLGMAFAAGWSPCIGPILSSILLYAGSDGNIPHAALLLFLYSAGLGVPFILTGVFFDRMLPLLGWFKKHMTAVRVVSGLLLLSFGLAMLSGGLSGLTIFFLKAGSWFEELSLTGPSILKPVFSFFAQWFSFQGL